MAQTSQNIDQARNDALQRFDAADVSWFEFLTDDAVVYAINHTEPYRGRAAYEPHFQPFLTRSPRTTTVLSSDVQMLGANAVVAQTLRIEEGDIIVTVRQSVIWANEDGWKIKHLHSALIGNPMSTTVPTTAAEVTVLNEKIATMAAVLGVAQ